MVAVIADECESFGQADRGHCCIRQGKLLARRAQEIGT